VFTYILRRILLMIPTLLGAVTLIFLVMRLLPGDAALYILGSEESSEVNRQALAEIRQELGLDRPLPVQYVQWLWGVVRLDFGTSYWTKQPVIEELAQRYPMTATLALLSLVLSTAIAVPVGVLSAVKQDSFADYAARIFVITGLSLPNFWLAILIILGLVHYFKWLPPLDYAPFWADPWLNFKQLVFPALMLAITLFCFNFLGDGLRDALDPRIRKD
jgi:peptide/nickel transport system permease protein